MKNKLAAIVISYLCAAVLFGLAVLMQHYLVVRVIAGTTIILFVQYTLYAMIKEFLDERSERK